MSLSTCEVCGGYIPLGPNATNRCETCGAFIYPAGIHPAKKPMDDGFSLDKFLSGITKEDAEALGEMFDQMEAEKRLNGWIPCADRFPEPDQEVLIYLDENSDGMLELGYTSLITIATYLGDMGEYESDWDADANAPIEDGCEPTHWMPLPEKPAV